MKYYLIETPEYHTDQEADRCNPIELEFATAFPSVHCPDCGIWASSDHLPASAVANCDISRLSDYPNFLGVDEWRALKREWDPCVRLGVVRPGLQVGPASMLVKGVVKYEIMHYLPSQIVLSDRVNNILSRFVGYASEEINLASGSLISKNIGLARYYLLCPFETLWQDGVNPSNDICKKCGRVRDSQYVYGAPVRSCVQEIHLAKLNDNPGRLVVSEVVADVLRQLGNCNLLEVGCDCPHA